MQKYITQFFFNEKTFLDHSLQYMSPDHKRSSDCIEVLGPTYAGKFLFLASLFLFNAAQHQGREKNNHSSIHKSAISCPITKYIYSSTEKKNSFTWTDQLYHLLVLGNNSWGQLPVHFFLDSETQFCNILRAESKVAYINGSWAD